MPLMSLQSDSESNVAFVQNRLMPQRLETLVLGLRVRLRALALGLHDGRVILNPAPQVLDVERCSCIGNLALSRFFIFIFLNVFIALYFHFVCTFCSIFLGREIDVWLFLMRVDGRAQKKNFDIINKL